MALSGQRLLLHQWCYIFQSSHATYNNIQSQHTQTQTSKEEEIIACILTGAWHSLLGSLLASFIWNKNTRKYKTGIFKSRETHVFICVQSHCFLMQHTFFCHVCAYNLQVHIHVFTLKEQRVKCEISDCHLVVGLQNALFRSIFVHGFCRNMAAQPGDLCQRDLLTK